MRKARKFFRRDEAPNIENKVTILSPEVKLKCGNGCVTGIACVSSHELIAVATWQNVNIYGYTILGEPSRVFEEHTGKVSGLMHLCDDVLASVDTDGMLLTWEATSGAVLDQLKVSNRRCTSIAKASTTDILVGTLDGEIVIVENSNGKKLGVKKQCTSGKNIRIYDISACNGIFVAALGPYGIEVYNEVNGELSHSILNGNGPSTCVAGSDDFIVMGYRDEKICVYGIRDGYNLLRTIELSKFHGDRSIKSRGVTIQNICFLNVGIVMVTTNDDGIYFVSVKSGECISHCNTKSSATLYETAVLSDGHVCIGGPDGYCAVFKPPQDVEDYIVEYNQRMHTPLRLSIEELQRGLRAGAVEELPAACDMIVEEVEEEEEKRRLTDGNEGSFAVDAKGEPLQNSSATGNVVQEKTDGGPSRSWDAENGGRDNSAVWRAIEMMELRNKELQDKMAKIELRNTRLEKTVAIVELWNKQMEQWGKRSS